MTILQDVLALLAMTAGAVVQGMIGFGASLLAVPLLVLIDPNLVPAPVIIASLVLNVLMIRRHAGAHHWRAMRWPIAGSVPGSVAGAAAVTVFAKAGLTVFFGVVVLLAVALSASGLHPRRTPRNLAVAGTLSGFMGTAVGIGGPPIALLFQHATGPEIRASLSRFFGIGSVISLVLLGAFGQLELADLRRSLVLIAGMVLGYAISGAFAHRVDPSHVRRGVLVLSALSAIIGIARALL
jgi:uncharacterized membrane protein YfcA